MPQAFNIAPRVLVYPHATARPSVQEGWLALPQLPAGAPAVMSSARGIALPSVSAGPSPTPPVPQEREGVVALPGRAVFGDGSHPTTRLCAAAVDLLCRQRPGMAVLDVGTGTGILARIARARGASFVAGTDIDAAALACAKAHAELDVIDSRGRCPSAGAIRAIHEGASVEHNHIYFGDQAPDHWGARFDLVVANILEAPLHSLAPALCRALVPGGVLVISGFTRPQVPALRLAYETAGLQSAGDFSLDEWVLLKFVARHPIPAPP